VDAQEGVHPSVVTGIYLELRRTSVVTAVRPFDRSFDGVTLNISLPGMRLLMRTGRGCDAVIFTFFGPGSSTTA
jgi:hypothetical protein